MLRSIFTRLSVAMLLCMMSLSYISAQATVVETDCLCSTDGENFEQTLTFTAAPSEIWTFVSANNFFQSVNPFVDFTEGMLITEVPLNSGNYELTGFRASGELASITLMNNGEEFTLELNNICTFPEIVGDSFVCEGSGPQTYAAEGFGVVPIWTVSPPVAVLSSTFDLVIDWSAAAPGIYTIEAAGGYTIGLATFCPETISFEVEVSENNVATQLACNNNLNISLNGACELQIVADMILEGDDINNDAFDVVIRTSPTGEPLTNQMVTQEYLGVSLFVEVRQQCGGNGCWGNLVVEDKSAPALTCPADIILSCEDSADPLISGLPLPDGVVALLQDDGSFIVEDFDFCGDATLRFQDELVDNMLCEGPFGSIIERIWILTDVSGNTSTCSQFISVERADLDQVITFPPNFDNAFPGANPSLEACGDFPRLDNGHPSPDFTGRPEGVFCANVTVEFEDTVLEVCGTESFKLIRRWVIQDICGGADDVLVFNQYITLEDTIAPEVSVPDNSIIVEASGHTCISDIIIPDPSMFVEDCSEWDYTVGFSLTDEKDDPDAVFQTDGIVFDSQQGLFVIENIEALNDTIWIVYLIEDVCGNLSTATSEIVVIDIEEPVAVCDLNTNVGLNEFGVGHAGVSTFDDGSFDNCSLDRILIRRVDGDPCGNNTAEFSEEVTFCCEDVGQTIQVMLRVYDAAGNHNECTVNVTVQDNIPPTLVSCPGPRTIDCDENIDDLGLFGSPVFTDECGFNVTRVDVPLSIGTCGSGSIIRRTFTATDFDGNTTSCVQILTLEDSDPFDENDIDFPDDIDMFDGCPDTDLSPENLPAGFNMPVFDEGPCDMTAASFKDAFFFDVDDVCVKVLRRWTVIEDCTDQIFTHTQTIRVSNTVAPEITCDNITITDGSSADCQATVQIIPVAMDDCTDTEDLIWTYRVNGGPVINGSQLLDNFAGGTHSVVWNAEDECGNIGSCTSTFTIDDNKNPTPICLESIITTIDEDGLTSEIWANDFIKEVFDNCSASEDITISFASDQVTGAMVFDCSDIPSGIVDSILIDLFITDEAGNQEFCSSTLILQDNNDVCEDVIEEDEDEDENDDEDESDDEEDDEDESDDEEDDDNEDDEEDDDNDDDGPGRASISGQVYSENNIVMPEVEINLSGEVPGYPISLLSDDNGIFAFNDVELYQNYSLSAFYDGSHLDGVSTLDLVLIQKHILGTELLDSPYKIIAADANNSMTVTAVDLIELRKLILGVYDELPQNEAWRFVDESFVFSDPITPFPFEENVNINDIDQDQTAKDFIAIKVGDVNNTSGYNGGGLIDERSDVSVNWLIENQDYESGDKLEIDIVSDSDMDLEGFQLSYNFNNLQVDAIVPGKLTVHENQYHKSDKNLKLSWYDQSPVNVNKGDVLFTLVATMEGIGTLASEFVQQNNDLLAESYTRVKGEIVINRINTLIQNNKDEGFVMYQNVPNPFSDITNINFNLPSDQNVTLTVMDYSGKVLFNRVQYFKKGMNRFEISADEIGSSGLLYLTIQTEVHRATQRILVLK